MEATAPCSEDYMCDYGDFITPTYMAHCKWKCFYVKHMVKRLCMTRQKSSDKGRSQGFLGSSGWQLFPTTFNSK